MALSKKVCSEIDHWLAKYPSEQAQSALLPALTAAQEDNGGHLTEALIQEIARYLNIPDIAAFEAATFYSMYDLKPVGQHKINVCTNVSCMLCGSDKIVNHLEKRLNVRLGETTEDGRFTLRGVECLAACVGAPMMQIDKTYYEHLTPEKVDQILDTLETEKVSTYG